MMYQRFYDYLNAYQLIDSDDRCLLAVSGGVDSMVLAHLFDQCKLPFAMACCHFGLRIAANKEIALVKATAQQYGVPFYTKTFDTQHYATLHKCSIQMAARKLRYQWFHKLLVQQGYTKIVTAHHHNDQMETCLHHFIKGTNLCGLQGMLPRRKSIIRPLLFATKEELYHHAKAQDLVWYEDKSNQSLKYVRNWIRHKIMPLFYHVNSHAEKTFFTTLSKLQQTQSFFEEQANSLKKQVWTHRYPYNYINIQQLIHKPWIAVLLSHWLEPFGFAFRPLQQWCSQSPQSGKRLYSSTHWLLADRNHWVIGPRTTPTGNVYTLNEAATMIDIPGLYTMFCRKLSKVPTIPHDNKVGLFDHTKLTFPLQVRLWQAGDVFCPLGMRGKHKKISDFLIDKKIALYQKEQTYVLCSNEEIVWLIGHRIDERYKITSSSKKIFCIDLKPSLITLPT